jgi:FAD/FMN-containing dehydrogenase
VSNALVRRLEDVVGPRHVLTSADLVAGFVADWTGRWKGHTTGVVRPGSVEEVQGVIQACAEFGVPVVPQGGNTGLVGGSIPHDGEVVVSLRRLDQLEPVDVANREVTVGAGATVATVQAHARRAGLAYGVDLASRESATVGGTIATNAGGVNVVAHGDTRAQLLGLEAVLADGRVVRRMDGVAKASIGPDPLSLLVGSEGSLGIVTAARLRLVPVPEREPQVTLMAIDSLEDGRRFLVPGVRAIEFFDRACAELVIRHQGLPRPLPTDPPFYLLLESDDLPGLSSDAAAVVDRRLWAYRERITESISRTGVPLKLDVAVPAARMDEFAAGVAGLGLDGAVYLYGHLAEANFHVNVVGPGDTGRTTDRILGLVTEMGGVVASEHGIGVAKAEWWRRSSDPAMIDAGRRIKQALDPAGLMNPRVFWS